MTVGSVEFSSMTFSESFLKNCPVCGAPIPEGGLKFIEDYSDGEKKWSLYECPDCEIQFWNPFKAPEHGYYEQFMEAENHFLIPWNYKEFFRFSPEKNGRLLDIGCNGGEFLSLCKKAGYSVYGLEINDYLVKEVKKKGIDCFFGYLEDFAADFKKRGGELFDCVTFFEVIEHLTDPRGFLADVRSVLKSGGAIALSTPFRERSEVFKMHDYPPGHVVRWNVASLSRLLHDSGFEVESVKVRPVSLHYVIGNFFQAYRFRNLNSFVKLALAVFLGILFWIPMLLKRGKGNRVFIIARKV